MSAQESPLVSVIVPIYNVEKYLPKCLDSILSQILDNIEVIGVDDGSTDRSGEILDMYARKDSRVRAIHQLNAGLGPARNAGLSIARGRYVGFIDSDDWVLGDMFIRLFKAAESSGADVVTCGYEIWTDGQFAERKPHPLAGSVLTSSQEIDEQRKMIYGRAPRDLNAEPYPVSACTSLLRRDVHGSARFENILSEDAIFNVQMLKSSNCWAILDYCGYRYRKDQQESITRSFSRSKLNSYMDFFDRLEELASEEPDRIGCLVRVKRKIADYMRSYIAMVEKSGLTFSQKADEVNRLVNSVRKAGYLNGYSGEGLPLWQRISYLVMNKGCARCSLILMAFRRMVKKEK